MSGIPPPTQAVTETISAVTDSSATAPAPEITEAVTSSLPSIPDVSLPSVSLPDISDVSTNNRSLELGSNCIYLLFTGTSS